MKRTLFVLLVGLFAGFQLIQAQIGWASFGENITDNEAVSAESVYNQLADKDSLNVKIKGVVDNVCQAKGCWMNVYSENPEKALFVKFKDYGFFVPKDCSGKEVIMEGIAYKEVTSVDELRHYAEDEGKSKQEIEAIDTPVEEYKFMASGVLVQSESK